MAQLGNTGINGNLMVVGKIVANSILSDTIQVKVINGGDGNSLIQQNSNTSGADIVVGSTGCPLKIQGKDARPTYRQGSSGTYANLALQSDIVINFNTNNTTAQTANVSEAIAGSGTINLHKVAKTGSYNDLLNTPTNHVTTDTTQTITGRKTFENINCKTINSKTPLTASYDESSKTLTLNGGN